MVPCHSGNKKNAKPQGSWWYAKPQGHNAEWHRSKHWQPMHCPNAIFFFMAMYICCRFDMAEALWHCLGFGDGWLVQGCPWWVQSPSFGQCDIWQTAGWASILGCAKLSPKWSKHRGYANAFGFLQHLWYHWFGTAPHHLCSTGCGLHLHTNCFGLLQWVPPTIWPKSAKWLCWLACWKPSTHHPWTHLVGPACKSLGKELAPANWFQSFWCFAKLVPKHLLACASFHWQSMTPTSQIFCGCRPCGIANAIS